MCAHICVCVHVHMHMHICAHAYVHMHMCMCVMITTVVMCYEEETWQFIRCTQDIKGLRTNEDTGTPRSCAQPQGAH